MCVVCCVCVVNGDGILYDVVEGVFDVCVVGVDEFVVDFFECGYGEEVASAARREDEARAFLRMEIYLCYNEE